MEISGNGNPEDFTERPNVSYIFGNPIDTPHGNGVEPTQGEITVPGFGENENEPEYMPEQQPGPLQPGDLKVITFADIDDSGESWQEGSVDGYTDGIPEVRCKTNSLVVAVPEVDPHRPDVVLNASSIDHQVVTMFDPNTGQTVMMKTSLMPEVTRKRVQTAVTLTEELYTAYPHFNSPDTAIHVSGGWEPEQQIDEASHAQGYKSYLNIVHGQERVTLLHELGIAEGQVYVDVTTGIGWVEDEAGTTLYSWAPSGESNDT